MKARGGRGHVGPSARARTLGTALFVLGLAACAPKVDARFAAQAAVADELYVHGRQREAAEAWLGAARVASAAHDRDEATYRAAASYERAGDGARAETLLATLAAGSGDRAARASFDRARLVSARDPSAGEALRLAALRAHPESGVAPHAFAEYLDGIEARAGAAEALTRCHALSRELAATDLDETASFTCASRSERLGDFTTALSGYLATAERHPYPRGALWDDALSAAARCEERLGDARAAIGLLERLLAEREHSVGIGSYERSGYAAGRFHIAELYRDALADPARARHEFRRVSDEHPTSLLGDDALFEEARLAVRMGDPAGACTTTRLLAKRYPDSRLTGCAGLVCAGAAETRRGCPRAVEAKFEQK